MVNLFRKYQQSLMLIITILVIIAFVWLYNSTQLDKIGVNHVATIYGKGVAQADLEKTARKAQLSMELGLFDMLQTLGGGNDQNQMIESFVWNSMVLKHEADALAIAPTDEQVIAELKTLPVFQTNGSFDPDKYSQFVEQQLPPQGMTQLQLEELVRDSLRLKQLRGIIDSTVEPSAGDFRSAYERAYAKINASVIHFAQKDFSGGINVTDEDLQMAFDARKESYKTNEKRKVSFITLKLSEAASKLTGKERTEKLQQLADRAQAVAQAMLHPGAQFEKVAEQFSLKTTQTVEFTRNSPDPAFANKDQIVNAAFALTKEDPNTDVLEDTDGFILLHLDGITPSRPLSFEEAKPQLLQALKTERAQEALSQRAAEVRTKLIAEIKAGKAFADAATALNLKPEVLPPFSAVAPLTDKPEQAPLIMSVALDLGNGQVSELTPTNDGGFLVFVANRQPIDEMEFNSNKAKMLPRYAESRRRVAFREWLRQRRNEARIQVTRS